MEYRISTAVSTMLIEMGYIELEEAGASFELWFGDLKLRRELHKSIFGGWTPIHTLSDY